MTAVTTSDVPQWNLYGSDLLAFLSEHSLTPLDAIRLMRLAVSVADGDSYDEAISSFGSDNEYMEEMCARLAHALYGYLHTSTGAELSPEG